MEFDIGKKNDFGADDFSTNNLARRYFSKHSCLNGTRFGMRTFLSIYFGLEPQNVFNMFVISLLLMQSWTQKCDKRSKAQKKPSPFHQC